MKSVRISWWVAIGLLLSCLIWSGCANAEAEDGVIESYHESSDLPDSIAFSAFLDLVNATRKRGNSTDISIVAEALGIDLRDNRGMEIARSRSDWFADAYGALSREKMVAGHYVLCTGNRASKSTEEILDAMNAVDDVERDVLERHFRITADSLSMEVRKILLAYLHNLKKGIQYTRIDSRKVYEAGIGNIRDDLDQRCYSLERAMALQGVE